jgi:hypothetical protein
MGAVQRLAAEVERGLRDAHPKLRKTVVRKVSLTVGAMIEVRTSNTAELANVLPLATKQQDMGEFRCVRGPHLPPRLTAINLT